MNLATKYAESGDTPVADLAPIRFYDDLAACTYHFKHQNGSIISGANLPASFIQQDSGQDMFVIEVYTDGGGRNLMLCYGFGWRGTYAEGKYFDKAIYPNLESCGESWIIVRWEDTNEDGFVNNPGDGDTYIVIATGLDFTIFI